MSRTLRFVLGDYPHTREFRRANADRFEFFPVGGAEIGKMTREGAFDLCEMPIVTYMQARALNKPFALLPITVAGRLLHAQILYNKGKGTICPGDLAGKRIGSSSYAKTTTVWQRGFLRDEFGFDPASAQWITTEPPYMPETPDPSTRAPAGRKIVDLLIAGELDVAFAESSDDPRVATLFPDPAAAAKAWREKSGFMPINHMVVVNDALLRREPETVREIFAQLKAGNAATQGAPPVDLSANRPALETILGYAKRENLLARDLSVDALFDERTRDL